MGILDWLLGGGERMTKPWHNPLYSCDGKERFADKAMADRAARRRKSRVSYRYQHCKYWHVGNRPSWKRGRL